MRRLALAASVCALLGLANRVDAQQGAQGVNTMPGQVVGNGFTFPQLNSVGQQAPQAAPQAGQSITANAMQRPFDPSRPLDMFKGTNIDPKTIIAPLTVPATQQTVFDKLTEKLRALVGSTTPPTRPSFAPGILRRTRERNEAHMWRRD